MVSPPRPGNRNEFNIAFICALSIEADAVRSVFDGHWRDHGGEFTKPEGDTNVYWTGWIGFHNVVLVELPGMGNTDAAGVAGAILTCFPRIRLGLVVGICGGVPGRTKKEMILGDVVISTQIVQLGLASRYDDVLIIKDTYEYQPGRPGVEIRTFLKQSEGKEGLKRLQKGLEEYAHQLKVEEPETYQCPGAENDRLYEAGYRHKHYTRKECDICVRCESYGDPVCETARKSTCSQLGCDARKLISRERLQPLVSTTARNEDLLAERVQPDIAAKIPMPFVHFGLVGSGDWIIKSQHYRDSVSTEAIAYEMEGLGVSHNLPTVIIKGVCDYADSHKNKDWQQYAAGNAAACMKAVLNAWPRVDTAFGFNEPASHHFYIASQPEPEYSSTRAPALQFPEEGHSDGQQTLIGLLGFVQMDSRRETIKAAHKETCKWLLEKSEYQGWLATEPQSPDQVNRFFWIKGKPGAGKSTMMKFLLANIERQVANTVVLSFFFHGLGDDLEKSTMGMYRSLLFQLFEKVPDLKSILNPILDRAAKNDLRSYKWRFEEIQNLFERAIMQLNQQSLMCFVDALDECKEDQVREMVDFFEQLSALPGAARLRICFSSRHYPNITTMNATQLVLERQVDHSQDLKTYLEGKLKAKPSKLIHEIKAEILEKACGVFLWVVLVVQILNTEYDHGHIHAMRKRLSEIPTGLNELFTDILTRDTQSIQQLVACLQWLLFASRPLVPQELYHAVLAKTEPSSVVPWDLEETDPATIWRFILSSTKGLAEVTEAGTVQFIHESVREYLKANVLQIFQPDSASGFEGLGHEQLKTCCQIYTEIAISHLPSIRGAETPLEEASEEASSLQRLVSTQFPFLRYAVQNILYHADAAAESKISQADFLDNFSIANWIPLSNFFDRLIDRQYFPTTSLLYILANENVGSLIHIERKKVENIDIQEHRFGNPLLAAIRGKKEKALRALLAPNDSPRPSMDMLRNQQTPVSDEKREAAIRRILNGAYQAFDVKDQTLLSWAAGTDDVDVIRILLDTRKVDVDLRDERSGQTPLAFAAERGHKAVLVLLATTRVDVNARDNNQRTPLSLAAEGGHKKVVKLLLARGEVEVDARDDYYRTPLSWAAQSGHHAVVRLLLATGRVDVNAKDNCLRTPSLWAVIFGHWHVLDLLLATSQVEVNARDRYGRTMLSLAAQAGHSAVVELLLATGQVDVDARDDYPIQRTPLLWAACGGHKSVVNLLLATGMVDVNARDNDGRTPLLWAAWGKHGPVVKLLLATGQVDVDVQDQHHRTPLWWAAYNGHEYIVKMLLGTGQVNVNAQDMAGETPLFVAIERGHSAVVKILHDWRIQQVVW